MWQWFSYIKVWSHWTYSSQNVGRKHLFLAQGEERRKKRGALESWSTEGTAISAWKGFEATVCGGVRGGGCLVPFIIPLCCFIHGGGTHHTLHCENILTILEQKEEMEYVSLEYETIFSFQKRVSFEYQYIYKKNLLWIWFTFWLSKRNLESVGKKYSTQSHFHSALFPELVNINLF